MLENWYRQNNCICGSNFTTGKSSFQLNRGVLGTIIGLLIIKKCILDEFLITKRFQLAIDPYGIYALIIAPTRELVDQIADQFSVLGKPISLRVCKVTGGRMQMLQAQELTK